MIPEIFGEPVSADPAEFAAQAKRKRDEEDFPFMPAEGTVSNETLRNCIRLNVARERERCAKIADTWEKWCGRTGYCAEEYASDDIAAKIRSAS